MLKNKKFRILLCLLTALMVLFAFSGCGDSAVDEEEDDTSVSSSDSSSEEPTESETKSGAYDITLGLGDGDTYVSRDDYYLLGDYFYLESYRIETTDGIVTELGLDMYITYDEDDGYSDPDGVLAIYYDEEGVMTSYEAYVGINPVRQMVSYQIGNDDSSYYTSICLDSDGNTTGVIWENYVYNSETGETMYYVGSETYYEDGSTESSYQEEYTVSDDGVLTLSKTTTKEYDEDGNVTTDETVEY